MSRLDQRRLFAGVAGAAVLIGVITLVARVAGFGRTFAFSQTVGTTCLGTAYFTANGVPNIVFEIVVNGALAGMVVPVLAAEVQRGDREHVRQTTAALLTWVALATVPLTLLVALAAGPLMSLLIGPTAGCDAEATIALAARMLVVFAPQVLIYGFAAVLYGVLQAHRHFFAPALAPLLSSLIVIGAYFAFMPLGDGYQHDVSGLPKAAELTLSLGTTIGVFALLVTALVPSLRLGLSWRPTLRFPPGTGRRVRALALASLFPLVAQQLSLLVVIMLSNWVGGGGALPVYNIAWGLFNLPYAVLALPIATSAFPELSARASNGEHDSFDTTLAQSVRTVVLVGAGGAAALAAAAVPLGRVFGAGEAAQAEMARALVTFAPGLIGFGLIALVGRALYASGHGRASAVWQVAGWLTVIAADVALVLAAPPGWTVPALGAGNTIGLTLGAVALMLVLVRARGRAAVAGLARTLVAGVLGAAAGYASGRLVAITLDSAHEWVSAGLAVGSGLLALVVFAAVAAAVDGRALRAALRGRRARAVQDER